MSRPQRELRKQMRQRQQRRRTLTFAVIAVLVLCLAGYLLVSSFTAPAVPQLEGNVIDISADMGGFSITEIRAKAGEAMTVRLTSLDNQYHTDGGGKHQWAVDELGVSIVAPPEGSSFATFTPDTPGKYTFYCDICCGGRANPTMNGTLIVEGRA